jgi:hypothetical protein
MKRVNFTLDDATLDLLSSLADKAYGGNKSLAIRAAVESLAAHSGHAGWVVAGYTPATVEEPTECHSCHASFIGGEILYRPVFQRGVSPVAMLVLPREPWLDCPTCAGRSI